MYAVIKTGGKQYRVSEGETLKIEKLEVEPGKKVTFNEVLMVADGDKVQVGSPLVAFATSGEPSLTLSPSATINTSSKVTFFPGSTSSFSILSVSPSDTRYCFPPVLITAYITNPNMIVKKKSELYLNTALNESSVN